LFSFVSEYSVIYRNFINKGSNLCRIQIEDLSKMSKTLRVDFHYLMAN
jgi:hypothetical protein